MRGSGDRYTDLEYRLRVSKRAAASRDSQTVTGNGRILAKMGLGQHLSGRRPENGRLEEFPELVCEARAIVTQTWSTDYGYLSVLRRRETPKP